MCPFDVKRRPPGSSMPAQTATNAMDSLESSLILRQWRTRKKRLRHAFFRRLDRCFVLQSLAADLLQGGFAPGFIGRLAMPPAEGDFVNVSPQVLLAPIVVHAHVRPFDQREEAIHGLRVDLEAAFIRPHIELAGMVDRLVADEIAPDWPVRAKVVRHENGLRANMLSRFDPQRDSVYVLKWASVNVRSIALH